MEGRKNDTNKVRLDLLPNVALRAIAWVLTFGTVKYDSWNWAQGMAWSRLIASARRHLNDFIDGIDYDEESGFLHLANLGCCVLFLLTYQILGLGKDDRYDYKRKGLRHDLDGTNPREMHKDGEAGIPGAIEAFRERLRVQADGSPDNGVPTPGAESSNASLADYCEEHDYIHNGICPGCDPKAADKDTPNWKVVGEVSLKEDKDE